MVELLCCLQEERLGLPRTVKEGGGCNLSGPAGTTREACCDGGFYHHGSNTVSHYVLNDWVTMRYKLIFQELSVIQILFCFLFGQVFEQLKPGSKSICSCCYFELLFKKLLSYECVRRCVRVCASLCIRMHV